MVLVLSPNSVPKPWVKEEMSAGVMRSITEKGAYVLAALLAKCSIPPLLSDKRYADFNERARNVRSGPNCGLQSLYRVE